MADGRPRITVTSARTATASLVARRGEGVDRRAPHQGPLAGERLAREVSERRVERRVELPPPPVEAAVETVSAAEVLAGVAEYGPNYSLPQPAEPKTARRKRLQKPPPWLIAVAPCTHAPEGSGWGAVDAVSGGLWYADALGRAASAGAGLFV